MSQEMISKFVDSLKQSNRVFVITGAGMSADSGLPTYRGIGGLYDNKNTEDGMPIEKALSGPVFRSQPEVTWKYLAQIEQGARGASFNRGHQILKEMETRFDEVWILTQNVDGFHSAAGSTNVIEIHGNMYRMRCTRCGFRKSYENYDDFQLPPDCPECESNLRPDVVLFEEQLPEKEINRLYECMDMHFDLVLSIGTSSYFPYIVQPVYLAHQMGVTTVEINPGQTQISSIVDIKLEMGAADALSQAWEVLGNE